MPTYTVVIRNATYSIEAARLSQEANTPNEHLSNS